MPDWRHGGLFAWKEADDVLRNPRRDTNLATPFINGQSPEEAVKNSHKAINEQICENAQKSGDKSQHILQGKTRIAATIDKFHTFSALSTT